MPRHPVTVSSRSPTKTCPIERVGIAVFVQNMIESVITLPHRGREPTGKIWLRSDYFLIVKVSPKKELVARFGQQVNKLARLAHVVEDAARKTHIESRVGFPEESDAISEHKPAAFEVKNLLNDKAF